MGKSRMRKAQEQAQKAAEEVNKKIVEMGVHTSRLYENLTVLQELFDGIRNVPSEKRLEYERLNRVRLEWKQQADKIEADSQSEKIKNANAGAAGFGAGIAVAALGPTAAMGIATTFGVASTGTAISTLSGAAATNAALAWLGGGALAAGGGGMAAGEVFLTLFGPVGWTIAGISLAGSGLLLWKGEKDKERLENIFALISRRDVRSFQLAIVEINERIGKMTDVSPELEEAIRRVRSFGADYDRMTEEQQYALGTYVNLMKASIQLLVNPILGLRPNYTEKDFAEYGVYFEAKAPFFSGSFTFFFRHKEAIIISLANLLYRIRMDDKDQRLLWKTLRKNKSFLASFGMKKKDFDFSIIKTVADALAYKYGAEKKDPKTA